jgi:pilus assembly protein Flp/PilA
MRSFISLLKDESGASAAEYALILGVIAAALVTAIGILSGDISTAITNIAAQILPPAA